MLSGLGLSLLSGQTILILKRLEATYVPILEVLNKHHLPQYQVITIFLLQPMQVMLPSLLAPMPHLFLYYSLVPQLFIHPPIHLLDQLPPKYNTLVQCQVLVIVVL